MDRSNDYSVEDTAAWLAKEFPDSVPLGMAVAVTEELQRAYQTGKVDGLCTAAGTILANSRKEREDV